MSGIKNGIPNLLLISMDISLILFCEQLCIYKFFFITHLNKSNVEVSCILTSEIVFVDNPERFISVFLNLIIFIDSSDYFFLILPSSNTKILSSFET